MKWISKVTTVLFTKVDSMLTNCQLLIYIRKMRIVFLVHLQRQVNDLVWIRIYFQDTVNNVIHRVTNLNDIVHRRLFRISSRFYLEKNHSHEISNYAHWNSYIFFLVCFPFQIFFSHLYAIVFILALHRKFSQCIWKRKQSIFIKQLLKNDQQSTVIIQIR